jgi:hypothetical protein
MPDFFNPPAHWRSSNLAEPIEIRMCALGRHGPDNWESDSAFMQRPNAERVQLDLFCDYRKNVELYPKWQAFLKEGQPATIIFWGQNDDNGRRVELRPKPPSPSFLLCGPPAGDDLAADIGMAAARKSGRSGDQQFAPRRDGRSRI